MVLWFKRSKSRCVHYQLCVLNSLPRSSCQTITIGRLIPRSGPCKLRGAIRRQWAVQGPVSWLGSSDSSRAADLLAGLQLRWLLLCLSRSDGWICLSRWKAHRQHAFAVVAGRQSTQQSERGTWRAGPRCSTGHITRPINCNCSVAACYSCSKVGKWIVILYEIGTHTAPKGHQMTSHWAIKDNNWHRGV